MSLYDDATHTQDTTALPTDVAEIEDALENPPEQVIDRERLLEHAALKHDRYDRRLFERVLNFKHDIPQQVKQDASEGKFNDSSRLFDFFSSAYKALPRVDETKENTPQGEFLKTVMGSKEYEELRPFTTLDEFAATHASFKFFQKVNEKEQELADRLANTPPEDRELDLDPESEKRYIIRQAIKEAKEDTEKLLTALTGAGVEKSPLGKWDPEIAMNAARVLEQNPDLLRVAEMAGRMHIVMKKAQKEKIRRNSGTIVGVEIGAELQRLLPTELFRIIKPKLKLLFHRDMTERRLQQYSVETEEELGRGPIICAIDFSSSMSWQDRHIWAKAVALVLMQVAYEQDRSFMVIPFNGGLIKGHIFTNEETGKLTPLAMQNLASLSPSGGTNFEEPLKKATEFMNDLSYVHKADVIFISDGDYTCTSEFIKWWKETRNSLGAEMYFFLIDNISQVKEMEQISNKVFHVNNEELTERADGLQRVFAV